MPAKACHRGRTGLKTLMYISTWRSAWDDRGGFVRHPGRAAQGYTALACLARTSLPPSRCWRILCMASTAENVPTPASLRLLREVYFSPPQPTLPEYILVSVLLIVALLVGMFWIA